MNPQPAILQAAVAEPSADELRQLDLSPPDSGALVRHPDGYYWLGADGRMQIGPYATAEEALADLNRDGDEGVEPDESLEETEQALGLSDWLDPDTGELAEGTHTRLEEH
jgi:hypothetical protein